MRVLMAWLGRQEVAGKDAPGPAPLTSALQVPNPPFERVVLLSDHTPELAEDYLRRTQSVAPVEVFTTPPINPVDYGDVHRVCVSAVERLMSEGTTPPQLFFFLNSGTAPMGSTWLLLGKSKYPATLVAWSKQSQSIETINAPFEISFEMWRTKAAEAMREASLERPTPLAFKELVHSSAVMERLISRAELVAKHNVPVLIEGESGTGKELLARAIHMASGRRGAPFVAVNCGAIPSDLVESELFGHKRGSFTGALNDRDGHFRKADGGTLFLDEIGELPVEMQVKLLRPLQESNVQPVGSSETIPVNVRVIAATNRNLIADVQAHRFREDLFYRLAVAVLKVPTLRERLDDIETLADHLLKDINNGNEALGLKKKHLTSEARRRLRDHNWPGNVRELASTLRRATVWSSSHYLSDRDIEDSLLTARSPSEGVLNKPLTEGFKIQDVLDEVEKHYIERALRLTENNKSEARKLLGFGSPQLLSQHMKRLGVG